MLKLGLVEPFISLWNSPALLVNKSSSSFDGGKLNEVTKQDSYPLPRIDRILNFLRDAKHISSIDLRRAFWQYVLKTVLSIRGSGMFQFTVVLFGHATVHGHNKDHVTCYLNLNMDQIFFCYLDGVIIMSSEFSEHVRFLNEAIDILKGAKLNVNQEKCNFFNPN